MSKKDTSERIRALEQRVTSTPPRTGVYIMKDKSGKIIYVGKSKNLKARLRAYFGGTDSRPMVPFLMARVHDLECIVTATEKEALILENTLIKKYRPRYNVNLRDDKNYFSIRIDLKADYPRFQLVRRIKRDGARYFGPYASSAAVKETLHFLSRIFPLRTCKDVEFRTRQRPCIEYEIGRCVAPCCDLITDDRYAKIVRDAVLFLEGHGKKLIDQLKKRMKAAADQLQFEEASRLRDTIAAITATLEKQEAVSTSFKDQDIFGFHRSNDHVQVVLIFVRGGKISGQKLFPLFRNRAENSEILSSLLKQFYDGETFVPQEIIIQEAIEDKDVIQEWLAEKREHRNVAIVVPKRGRRLKLLEIAQNSAENAFMTAQVDDRSEEKALESLAKVLRLESLPQRIECFDISNIQGRHPVGSMVVFAGGRPDTAGYRKFRIRHTGVSNDYAMMAEVLRRRYRDKNVLPDLVVVDGGKGQLNVALAVFRELGVEDIRVIGLAKEHREEDGRAPRQGARERVVTDEDRVYVPKRKNPVYLSRYPQALFLLQSIRDEAHRFAVTYHRRLREREDLRSVVDGIPGIGAVRRKALLRYFKDIKKIKDASREDLAMVAGIGPETAALIYDYFHPQ